MPVHAVNRLFAADVLDCQRHDADPDRDAQGDRYPTVTPTAVPDYPLTILHTNDMHANHTPDANGDGGAARAMNVIQQVRSEVDNTLLVNAGDNFTGSLFYYVHRGQDSVELMNAAGYDVMTLAITSSMTASPTCPLSSAVLISRLSMPISTSAASAAWQ